MRVSDPSMLFSENGGRKYLCVSEVLRFLEAASHTEATTYTFCRLLTYTGCRISEALAVTPQRLDQETGRVVFRTLKRRRLAYRAVPVPPELMKALCDMGAIANPLKPLWPWCRQTAYLRIKAVMTSAKISGPQATPKGLRHSYGVASAEENIPMAIVQKNLGHASLETTAIYQQAVGREERAFAERLWRKWQPTTV